MNLQANERKYSDRLLEILALDDDSQCYGFLIESPEPVNWERTTMGVLYSSTGKLMEEASEPIKIIGASISNSGGGGTNFNSEWVDILLRESFDINGVTVEHAPEGVNDFQTYISFSSEKSLPAGTIIRIHTGKKEYDANVSSEMEHRYLESDNWKFTPEGETIRVVDHQGKILHTRYIAKAGTFSTRNIICIRNSDNTRAFVFFPTNEEKASKIERGNYRFDFRFKRNIGDAQPILKRMGMDNDEETYIEFSLKAK